MDIMLGGFMKEVVKELLFGALLLVLLVTGAMFLH